MEDLDDLIRSSADYRLTDVEMRTRADAIGVSRVGLYNELARQVSRRFLDGRLDFERADAAMVFLWPMVLADDEVAIEQQGVPEPFFSIYDAFDAGEVDLGDGVDRVEAVTRPRLREILAGGA